MPPCPTRCSSFMRLQRCGDNPVTGKKCHQQDAIDTITGEKVDLVGGWHDAADRLKHMITTSYCVAALALCSRRGRPATRPATVPALVKKLHPGPDRLYIQIGDDRDHMPPADALGRRQVRLRLGPGRPPVGLAGDGPARRAEVQERIDRHGQPGRALLGGDGARGRRSTRPDRSTRWPRTTPARPCRSPSVSPYYYGESTYFDDLEWAAVELFRATRESAFLDQAIAYADQAGNNPWMGKDRHGHYEFFPYVNLAHWRLYPLVDAKVKQRLAGYYRAGLERIRDRAERNPYRDRHAACLVLDQRRHRLRHPGPALRADDRRRAVPRAGRRGPRLDLRPQSVGRLVRDRRPQGGRRGQPAAPPLLQAGAHAARWAAWSTAP